MSEERKSLQLLFRLYGNGILFKNHATDTIKLKYSSPLIDKMFEVLAIENPPILKVSNAFATNIKDVFKKYSVSQEHFNNLCFFLKYALYQLKDSPSFYTKKEKFEELFQLNKVISDGLFKNQIVSLSLKMKIKNETVNIKNAEAIKVVLQSIRFSKRLKKQIKYYPLWEESVKPIYKDKRVKPEKKILSVFAQMINSYFNSNNVFPEEKEISISNSKIAFLSDLFTAAELIPEDTHISDTRYLFYNYLKPERVKPIVVGP